ncbi:MAG TPA: PAS domain S-box protein, partial [Candidatus Moranbacteria bacterium]|nr:PAS domain S-box protein [Candidatus Moranbacteria bacterium]
MEKEHFINEKVNKLIQFWVGWAVFFGGIFFVVLSLMDYIATPENFKDFLKYRFLGAFSFCIIFLLNLRKIKRTYQLFLIYVGVIISTFIIEYMILHFGGHSSTYYAGIFILIMVVVGFIPIGLKHSIILSLIALSIFVTPILLFDKSIDFRYFSMPIFFLLSTFTIANVWRYLSQKRLISELSLQYDLDQEKNKLKDYSSQLEDMVEERTKALRKSETMLKSLYENANDGIVITDTEGVIIDVNKRAAELHGFDNAHMKGLNVAILELEKNRAVWDERRKRLLDGEALIFETEHYRKDGSAIAFEVSSKAITLEGETFIQSLYRDISEKKRLF